MENLNSLFTQICDDNKVLWKEKFEDTKRVIRSHSGYNQWNKVKNTSEAIVVITNEIR